MKKINHKLRIFYLAVLSGLLMLTSCNKQLEQFPTIPTPIYPTGNGVAATLAADPNYSFYNALITRSGMTATLNDLTKTYTLFATDNAGMKIFLNALGVPVGSSDATYLGFISGTLPAASAAGIVQYNTVGQQFAFSSIGNTFPNYPLPSQIILDATQPFVRMPIFPARGTPYSYVNNVPVIATDKAAANGVIHTLYSIAAPPSATLRTMIAAEPTLSYFRAAILRADSGAVVKPNNDSTNFLNYLLGYGVTNMTVLPPNDVAFQTLIFGLVYSQVLAAGGTTTQATTQANAAVALGPGIFTNPLFYGPIPASTVKGIIAYHFLASSTGTTYQPNIRVFSNNVPSTPIFIKTLVNAGFAAHPGVSAVATYTGPAVTSLKFAGVGAVPPAPPFTVPANVVAMDKHAVNGVYHIIDKVLLPQ